MVYFRDSQIVVILDNQNRLIIYYFNADLELGPENQFKLASISFQNGNLAGKE